jgi:hypothetical protein
MVAVGSGLADHARAIVLAVFGAAERFALRPVLETARSHLGSYVADRWVAGCASRWNAAPEQLLFYRLRN